MFERRVFFFINFKISKVFIETSIDRSWSLTSIILLQPLQGIVYKPASESIWFFLLIIVLIAFENFVTV